MKYFFINFFIAILIGSTIKARTLNTNEEINGFCAPLNTILHSSGVFSSHLYIEIIDKTFDNCLKPSNRTYLTNVCRNETSSISESSLVIVKSVEQLSLINLNCFNYKGYHLMVIRNEFNESEVNELVNMFWKRFFINVTFLVVKDSKILLETFIPFNDVKCNDIELKMINQFDVQTQEWKNDQFFPEKLVNFHNCRLTVTTHKNVVPYIVREEYINGNRILSGRVIEMIDALAISLNFTTDLDYYPSVSAYETCMGKVANRESELFIGNIFLDSSRTTYLDFSVPIFFEFLKFVVPPGRMYNQYENLTRTFDNQTWILIFFVLLSCAALVFIISNRSKDTKVSAFGVRYDNAFMDFVADVLGMSRVSMPDSLIPRLTIIKFVIFTFVIRTLYQASLFKILNSDGRLKPAQSVEEIVSKGYTVYSLALYENYMKQTSRKLLPLDEFDELLKNISNPNFKGTLMHTGSLLMYKNSVEDRNYTNVFCKEDLMTIPMVGYLPKNSYLTEVVNAKILIFHSAGLIDIWDRRSKDGERNVANEDHTPEAISVDDVESIFQIYLMAAAVSILTFLCEMVHRHFKRKLGLGGLGVSEC